MLFRKIIRNSKGLTLVELLAVIVILGIISVIAMLSILTVIENSRKDAHIANAQIIANAVKIYAGSEKYSMDNFVGKQTTLKKLIDEGFINQIKDPSSSGTYNQESTFVTIVKDGNDYQFSIVLVGNNGNTYINNQTVSSLKREEILIP